MWQVKRRRVLSKDKKKKRNKVLLKQNAPKLQQYIASYSRAVKQWPGIGRHAILSCGWIQEEGCNE
jgi:hypothetical protein